VRLLDADLRRDDDRREAPGEAELGEQARQPFVPVRDHREPQAARRQPPERLRHLVVDAPRRRPREVVVELGGGERRDARNAGEIGDAVDHVAPEAARAVGMAGEAVAGGIREAGELAPDLRQQRGEELALDPRAVTRENARVVGGEVARGDERAGGVERDGGDHALVRTGSPRVNRTSKKAMFRTLKAYRGDEWALR
jgi:hypothetical protein